MKKLFLILVLSVVLSLPVFGERLYDPDDYPVITWEEAGSNYLILEQAAEYTVISVNGKLYVVYN